MFRSVGVGIINFNICSFLQVIYWYVFIVHLFELFFSTIISCVLLYYPVLSCSSVLCPEYYYYSAALTQILYVPCISNKSGGSRLFPPPVTPQKKMAEILIWTLLTLVPLSHPCTLVRPTCPVLSRKPISPILIASALKENFSN